MDWYYMDGKNKVGPASEADVEQLVRDGKITPDTLVWNEIMSSWQPYRKSKDIPKRDVPLQEMNIKKTFSASEGMSPDNKTIAQNQSVCAECGRTFPADEMIQYSESMICVACKPIFFQKLKEGVSLPNIMEYAGFWVRLGAKFIDGIIMGLVNMLVSFMGGFMAATSFTPGAEQGALNSKQVIVIGIVYIVQISFTAAYSAFFVGKFAATPGKMACGIKVVTADGGAVSYARALGRHFAEFLSSLTLLIGYIMAAFDDEKRTLHDRICNTRVIRK